MTDVTIYAAPLPEGPEASHRLLRRAASLAAPQLTDCTLARQTQGKPWFPAAPELHFSISHSGGRWVCAFADAPVGLDLQAHRPCRALALARRFFAPEEAEWLRSRGEAAFFDLWCAKESWLKYTGRGLSALPEGERVELLDWVANLPLYAYAFVSGRPYAMVHAGIRPGVPFERADEKDEATQVADDGAYAMGWSDDDLRAMLEAQRPEDLVWIREEFWGQPTGLLDSDGRGPIVIAGHTPTPYLQGMADLPDRLPLDENGLCRMVMVGASAQTGGVADRWDIDCGAAGGAGFGNLLMLRLDDGQQTYEPVREGE